MTTQPVIRKEETLDPEDWGALRELGHRMLDDMFDWMETVRERPVWQPMPDDMRRYFTAPIPEAGQSAEAVYQEFVQYALPYPMGNVHPRFWGWVMGDGTPLGVLADMIAATFNPNMGGGDHAGTQIELQVIEWCKQMMGFPQGASGLLTSGGSMANLIALVVARHAQAGYDVRTDGVAVAEKTMTIYASSEVHSSVTKAVELLGLGNKNLRKIPVDDAFRIDVAALRQTLEDDIANGYQPGILVGCAGTVNTGAVDALDELADIADEYTLWYHIDGAFGAMAYLSPEYRPSLKGMERADSLAFDLHKWGYMPFEVGCVLVRDEYTHRHAFSLRPDYLQYAERGLAGHVRWLSDYGPQLSRGFRALKVWMTFKHEGVAKMGRLIQQNIEQARYFTELVEEAPQLELMAPTEMNVVSLRFVVPGKDDAYLDAFNEELLLRLQESGVALPSSTHLKGRYAIRSAITNHRTRREDVEIATREIIRIGEALLEEDWQPQA